MANLSYGTGSSSYYDLARQQRVFIATANVTAPVIYTTAAGTGGPLLWNNSAAAGINRVMALLLAVGVSMTTVSTAGSGLGITGNSGQTAAPTTTTAIDKVACTYVGSPVGPQCNTYRIGTVANAGGFFMPTHSLDTAAITATPMTIQWVDIAGSIIVPPGSWASVSSSATATAAVMQIGLMWAEVPF